MAGNLVKWWKHKILGGYKQFSVQECTTDSEELMYHQVRASSSCSAPPDLLLVSSERENNIPLRSPVANITVPTNLAPKGSSSQNKHQPQELQQQSSKDIMSKHLKGASSNCKNVNKSSLTQVIPEVLNQQQKQTGEGTENQQLHYQQQQSIHHGHNQHLKEEHIRLEEFTCDVSVEGGKSLQPLQFSFTFYDLDGHHGKITKDDIVGIVYTIYESIGKSVVVPHCGSKTINVRLTVSPEGKSKASANVRLKRTPAGCDVGDSSMGIVETSTIKLQGQTNQTRRQHRYRPRKLIKSEDEDEDSNSEKDKYVLPTPTSEPANKSKNNVENYNKVNSTEIHQCYQRKQENGEVCNNRIYENLPSPKANFKCTEECRDCQISQGASNIVPEVQFSTTDGQVKHATRVKMLRRTRKQKYQDHYFETRQRSFSVGNETCWKNRETLMQQQPQVQQLYQQIPKSVPQQDRANASGGTGVEGVDTIDGVQLRNSLRNNSSNNLNVLPNRASGPLPQKRNSAECWKTALNRNDLISIIRESMEKNRLCFQMNGKPQANVSPIRQSQQCLLKSHLQPHQHQQRRYRQRSSTVSKIPTLIANHNNSSINTTNHLQHISSSSKSHNNRSSSNNNNNNNSNNIGINNDLSAHDSSNISLYHPQPHVPIYHQQMAINPAVLAAQNNIASHNGKINLCGYDSFLHATICGGGGHSGNNSHSPPPPLQPQNSMSTTISNQPTIHHNLQQPIATVQPIMTGVNAVPTTKLFRNSMPTNPTRYSKDHRGSLVSQATQDQQNQVALHSPQYHGYQRLSSSANQTRTQHEIIVSGAEKKVQVGRQEKHQRMKNTKTYDNLFYAKLSAKLHETSIGPSNEICKENLNRRKLHSSQLRSSQQEKPQKNPFTSKSCSSNSSGAKARVLAGKNEFEIMIPVIGDSIECVNLLGQTTDEETPLETKSHQPNCTDAKSKMDETVSKNNAENHPYVATATLINLNDVGKGDTEAGIELNANNEEDEDDDDVEAELNVNIDGDEVESVNVSPTNAAIATENSAINTSITSASSLIHRYVHEHIHHHYHHFEEKDE